MTAAKPNATGAPGYTAELTCVPESVGSARALVSSVLAAWGLEDYLADCAEIIISELLTNVVDHTETDLSTIFIERKSSIGVRIAVSDQSHAVPCVKSATGDAESGRGLRLVDALSRVWGYDTHSWGKVTWAEIEAPVRSGP
ncbi:ATP-binding protein [Streptomyces sp. NBC_01022]|uniref:ATP-binding protein n=1 Tax=Streptomyces sp. NBC_01022 TaxID=2903723 RepID=UPI002DD7E5FB|nr:ATP-binding protein [Streptomyces sp. NBC_01022]WRZ87162.1 ATP-binding protein [Streptomyces sp. NBC_01022]